MGHRRDVLDGGHLDTRVLNRTDSGVAARTRALHQHLDPTETMFHRSGGGTFGGLLSGVGGALAAALDVARAGEIILCAGIGSGATAALLAAAGRLARVFAVVALAGAFLGAVFFAAVFLGAAFLLATAFFAGVLRVLGVVFVSAMVKLSSSFIN